ncbi:MAG: magnesium transporter [Pseudomonadota bacterium]|nr:magnesium transporter [Pseudomonadota bacterium]
MNKNTEKNIISFKDQFDPSLVSEIISYVDSGDQDSVIRLIKKLPPSDIADIINLLKPSERKSFIECIKDEFQPEILSDLEDLVREEVIKYLGYNFVANILPKLETDDAVHVIEDLKDNEKDLILQKIPQIDREELQLSLNYPDDSAGRLMSLDFVSVPPYWNVGEVIDYFRKNKELPNEFYEIYLIDPYFKPIATLSLSNILKSNRSSRLEDLQSNHFVTIPAKMDKELVAHEFERFDLVSAPVIDENDRLIGVITADDIVDVIKDEAGEDIKFLGGVGDENITDNVLKVSRGRFSWLFVNLLTAILASIVIGIFDATIQEMVALAILMPIVASMGGNAGTQTLTIAVRSLSTRELVPLNYKRIINKEILVSFYNGIFFAIIIGTLSAIWFSNLSLGVVLAFAMVLNMVIAGLSGILIPLSLNKVGIDPDIASTVFLTTITDVVGFFVFLGLAAWLLV